MKTPPLLLLILAFGRCMAQQSHAGTTAPVPPKPSVGQVEAHEAVMGFLRGVRITPLAEGKQLLAETQWVAGSADRGRNFYSRPNYVEVTTLYAGLFATDVPLVSGYKELFDMKAVTKTGVIRSSKYLVVGFRDTNSGKWKVLFAQDNVDSDGNVDDSGLDIDRNIELFKERLAHTLYGSSEQRKEEYAIYGQWLLVGGRIKQAQTALQKARDQSANPSSVVAQPLPPAVDGESPIERIARIASQTRASPIPSGETPRERASLIPSGETPLERAYRTARENLDRLRVRDTLPDPIRDLQIDSLLNVIARIAPQVVTGKQ